VGIKYDLLAEEKPRGPVATPRPKQREGSPRGKQKPISKERPVVAKLEPTVAKATAGRARRKEKEQGQERQQPAPKPEPRFAVEVQRTATATTTLEVTAKTGALAKKMALERAGEAPVDVSRAVVRTRILSVRKMKTNN
jgi:hypothetical protein